MHIQRRREFTKRSGKVRVLLISYPDRKARSFTVAGTTLPRLHSFLRSAINKSN